MKIRLLSLIAIAILISCNGSQPKNEENTDSNVQAESTSEFDKLKTEFVDALWVMNPIWASYEGYHKYDDQLPIPNQENRNAKMEFSKRWLDRLSKFDLEGLNQHDQIDYLLIEDYLNSIPFYIETFKEYEWNPSSYNLGGSFFQVLNYRKDPLEKRLENVSKKMEFVEEYYNAAKENIKSPTQVHTGLALQQLEGSKNIFEIQILDSLKKSNLDESLASKIQEQVKLTVAAIDGYIEFLKELEPALAENGKDFRIGKELFEEKFKYQIQSEYTAEEIFQTAIEEKTKLHDNLYRISDALWEKYLGEAERPGNRLGQIQMVIDEVSKQHAHRDSFVTVIRKQIPELEAFVRENNLLTLDPNKPLVVRETPEYMRGFAGASISAPGPYDKDAETYYNVTPLDDYTDEQAESWLREYNDYTLQILNIHEAIPGHYAQLVYSNQSPSIIKSILGNGAMVEGWAVYSERMMLENEYGGDNMEIGLMYYKWNLRTVCNTILDYGIHVLGFTEEEAMQLLVKEAFQEQAEAEGKWRRARLSQVQLCSYFTGFHEIMELRDTLRSDPNFDFQLKEFHEQFLSYGSSPVKYIKRMMMKESELAMESAENNQ